MTTKTLKADYLIIGSGAMGMAFADVLMTEGKASIVMVDRHDRPGGHWNDAYSFVRLHQPSSFYGVNSRKLGNDTIDQTGWNAGLFELASGAEVVSYFDQVMQQQFLPTGRLQYFPLCDYEGDRRFVSRLTGERYRVEATRVVDATYMNVEVPSVRGPRYDVSAAARCIPPNDLPRLHQPATGYVVIGGGKTAMDACLWLLGRSVAPDLITWIMPRDSWMLDRANIQPGGIDRNGPNATPVTAPAQGTPQSAIELLDKVHGGGGLLRLDDAVRPTMYRCATVTRLELEQLRKIRNVVRMGHVQAIGADVIRLDEGTVATSRTHVHINCTADGLARRPPVPVFQGDSITLQAVRTCQQVFSAALIGHLECSYRDEAHKNLLARPVPHPDTDLDWIRVNIESSRNQLEWMKDKELVAWLIQSRLDGFSGSPDPAAPLPSAEATTAAIAALEKGLAFQQPLYARALAGG